MRYTDNYEEFDYDYFELAENSDDLNLDEPWANDDTIEDEVPSYGKNYFPEDE
jgi:hypothetical protein